MKTVTLYTDGACSGNPGPGGWGAILMYGSHQKELSGGEAQTTNNRMELTGVISALKALKEPCVVELWSDSKYVIDALEKGWIAITPTGSDWLGLALVCFVLPAVLSWVFCQACRRAGWIKEGDLLLPS